MNGNKEQQLTFGLGMTNMPGDATCDDNALEECLGLTFADGEHHVIQNPAQHMSVLSGGFCGTRFYYVHKLVNATNYIGATSDGRLIAGYNDEGEFAGYPDALLENVDVDHVQVTSIGKTLIVSNGSKLYYFLWKEVNGTWKYLNLGTRIPTPKLLVTLRPCKVKEKPRHVAHEIAEAGIQDTVYDYTEQVDAVSSTGKAEGTTFIRVEPGANYYIEAKEVDQEKVNELVIGLYAKNKKAVAQKKCFCNPFFVRVALELYDGSYTHIGNPILLIPSVTNNSWTRFGDSEDPDESEGGGGQSHVMYTIARQLMFQQQTDYTDWDDIVKDVVIFASDSVDIYDTTMDVKLPEQPLGYTYDGYHEYFNTVQEQGQSLPNYEDTEDNGPCRYYETDFLSSLQTRRIFHINPLTARSPKDITNDLKNVSIFYKLCKVGKKAIINKWKSTREYIEKGVLENLTTQEQLEYDDYYSHCELSAESMYVYNSRLNLASISRGFFSGFTGSFIASHNSGYNNIHYYVDVYIRTDEGQRIVRSEIETPELIDRYFYYPDPRAERIIIYNGGTEQRRLELEEHSGLNGALYIDPIGPISVGRTQEQGTPQDLPEGSDAPEHLPNYVVTSDVNNPYEFKSKGYNKVGTGKILAMATQTVALSPGTPFGSQPLIIFTDEGMWALSVNKTGLYDTASPLPREVLNNPKSVTPVDGAVFFSSEKGLMAVVGSEVKCVSEQLSGKSDAPFQSYLRTAYIAYDYRDSLLWIFNGSRKCWIYNIKSGTFAQYEFVTAVANVVNDYPDYLLQAGAQVYSLLDRLNINEDLATYQATMTSRPMKLENGLALKSIMQMRNIKDMAGTLAVTIKAANDLSGTWTTLTSLRGRPWKYYKFRYDFEDLSATDRFAGTVIVTQERRTNKLR